MTTWQIAWSLTAGLLGLYLAVFTVLVAANNRTRRRLGPNTNWHIAPSTDRTTGGNQ